MNKDSWKKISPSFRKRADGAALYEAWVGAVLARAGLYTLHHPFVADGGDYHGLTWDLDVSAYPPLTSENVDVKRSSSSFTPVEVKSLSVEFTGPNDYPYNRPLVCSQNSWLKKWPGKDKTQRDFLFVSKPTGAIVWLPVGSPVELGCDVTDGNRGETYKVAKTWRHYLRPLYDFVEEVRG
jgi:hypothetical protein